MLLLAFLIQPREARAHPVPKRSHDRTITVGLQEDTAKKQLTVAVDYRLEVDEFTAVYDDLPALGDQASLGKLKQPRDFFEAFVRGYAPILGANLVATIDGQPLSFRCVKQGFTLNDENGVPLNHLRCDFRFQAEVSPVWPEAIDLFSCWPCPGLPVNLALRGLLPGHLAALHQLKFKEANYELEEGQIRLTLADHPSLTIVDKIEPDPKLMAKPSAELQPGDDAKLRNLHILFSTQASEPSLAKATDSVPPSTQKPNTNSGSKLPSLYHLFVESEYGFWALLLLAAAIGAVHALTPGHGKTLVAAYLVGERGTVGHAIILGIVTTLTHTGVVLAIAFALRWFSPQGEGVRQGLQMALGLGGGLLIALLGAWLLLRRLTGQADHIHLPGQGHHHHHHDGHSGHYHDEQGNAHPLQTEAVGWWRLIALGISGGIIPCWDAILMLIVAVSTNLLWLALPMLLAFSAGLAGVLILIGILVVRVKGFAGSRWGRSRLFRTLPVVSAAAVTVLGLWLCYDSVHAGPSLFERPRALEPSATSPLGERLH